VNYTAKDRVQAYWLLQQWRHRVEQDLAVQRPAWLVVRARRDLERLSLGLRSLTKVIQETWVLEHESPNDKVA